MKQNIVPERTILIKPKNLFKEAIIERISKGKELHSKSISTLPDLEDVEKKLLLWNDYNIELLKSSFNNPSNEYRKTYTDCDSRVGIELVRYVSINSPAYRAKILPERLTIKITFLESLLERIDLMHLPEIPVTQVNLMQTEKIPMGLKKIFISHSSKDNALIDLFIDLLEVIGIKDGQIFYSSDPAYGVEPGENILERLKRELDAQVLVLFILSDNFYKSPVCLCEMGATWIKTNKQIPILMPLFDFDKIKGVFPNTLSLKINDKHQLTKLKKVIETDFNLAPINDVKWEKKRDNFLSEIIPFIEKEKTEKMEAAIKLRINSENRILVTDLKNIIGEEPKSPMVIGNLKLRVVYLNSEYYTLD
jgi:hypothetical protein